MLLEEGATETSETGRALVKVLFQCDGHRMEGVVAGPECPGAETGPGQAGGEAGRPGEEEAVAVAEGGPLIAGWNWAVEEAAGHTDVVASPAPPSPVLLCPEDAGCGLVCAWPSVGWPVSWEGDARSRRPQGRLTGVGGSSYSGPLASCLLGSHVSRQGAVSPV